MDWDKYLPPTPAQGIEITRMFVVLRIFPRPDELPRNRKEAKQMLWEMTMQIQALKGP